MSGNSEAARRRAAETTMRCYERIDGVPAGSWVETDEGNAVRFSGIGSDGRVRSIGYERDAV